MNVPTLQELLERLDGDPEHTRMTKSLFVHVATGTMPPVLKDNTAVFAAQAMVVLIKHVEEHGANAGGGHGEH